MPTNPRSRKVQPIKNLHYATIYSVTLLLEEHFGITAKNNNKGLNSQVDYRNRLQISFACSNVEQPLCAVVSGL